MALPEEFEFISYRCAYCQAINPAKKQKPKPPPLVTSSPQIRSINMKGKHRQIQFYDFQCVYN